MIEQGTVKFFDSARGFGFIAPNKSGSGDVFVHISALPMDTDLSVGDRVQFTREMGRNGRMQAAKVELKN